MVAGSSYTNVFGGSSVKPSQPSYEALTIAANTALVWPTETTQGEPSVAALIDVTPTVINLQLAMPPGNTGSTGVQAQITNIGAHSFAVTDQAGNAITTIAPTQSWLIALTDNSTVNGSWRSYQLAATASSATAGQLAGPGLQAVGTELQTQWLTASLAANTLLVSTYRSTIVVWTGGVGTLQLDTSANLTAGWFCAVTNEGTAAITLATSDGEIINGQGSITVQPGNSGIVICEAGAFNTVGALITVLGIAQGGTGASTASGALTNLGATSIGESIFTAPTASSVIALLGLNNYTFTEVTTAVGQTLAAGSTNTVFVCTAALALLLPLTTTLSTKFVFCAFGQGGAVTLTPQSSDAINGGTAGAAFTIQAGASGMVVTDANGNWYVLFLSVTSIPPPGVLFGDIKDNAVGLEGGGWRQCYGQARPQTDPFWQYIIAQGLTGIWAPGFSGSSTYNMPDLRGRTTFGLDDMGGAPANRITPGVSGITATALLATGGDQHAQQDTLAAAATSSASSSATTTINDPTHNHTFPTNTIGGGSGQVASNGGAAGPVITTSSSATGITATTSVSTSVGTTVTVTSGLTGASQNMPPAAITVKMMYVGA